MPHPTETVELVDRHFADLASLDFKSAAPEADVLAEFAGPLKRNRFSMVHTRLVTAANKTATLGAIGNRAGGIKLIELPEIAIAPRMARVRGSLSLSAGTATLTSGVVGVGSVIATGNVAVLNGTPTFMDIAVEKSFATIGAGATLPIDVVFGMGARTGVDGRSSGLDVHLNFAGIVGEATSNLVVAAGAIVDLFFDVAGVND